MRWLRRLFGPPRGRHAHGVPVVAGAAPLLQLTFTDGSTLDIADGSGYARAMRTAARLLCSTDGAARR